MVKKWKYINLKNIKEIVKFYSIVASSCGSGSGSLPHQETLVCCSQNEAPRDCVNICTKRHCSTKDNPPQCKIAYPAEKICDCIDGFWCDLCGICVPENQCNKTCEYEQQPNCAFNETFEGCFIPERERTCKNYQIKLPPQSPGELCVINTCHCKDNFVLNENGDCVHFTDSDKKFKKSNSIICRGPYEEVVKVYRESQARNCTKRWFTECEIQNERVKPYRCDCIKGFLRNSGGKCVRKENCKIKYSRRCTDPCPRNKYEIASCLNMCNEHTCKYWERISLCLRDCIIGCNCIEGYRKDDSGQCRPEEYCLPLPHTVGSK